MIDKTPGKATFHYIYTIVNFEDGKGEIDIKVNYGFYATLAFTNQFNGVNIITSYNTIDKKIYLTAQWNADNSNVIGNLYVSVFMIAAYVFK